jgi:hypothetical protein
MLQGRPTEGDSDKRKKIILMVQPPADKETDRSRFRQLSAPHSAASQD